MQWTSSLRSPTSSPQSADNRSQIYGLSPWLLPKKQRYVGKMIANVADGVAGGVRLKGEPQSSIRNHLQQTLTSTRMEQWTFLADFQI
ncbi:hypothetical protein E3N88_06902 [Mikania micrantha]|uniref:Uncharacterized protein n=1 Tax=Mikania micrantha TaxID=192012 RepID=A0A5N6PRB2_9ASTR|nr:hypothetical protein E3N88_06902 [Mikania micrantha]